MCNNSKQHLCSPLLLSWVALFGCAVTELAAKDNDARPPSLQAAEVLAGVRGFFARTACPDGSFHPGIDPRYPGMADSAYSDLAAVTYAVVLHKTFGWKLPHDTKTQEFLLARQEKDGAFRNERGTADPHSPQARIYNTTQGIVALRALGVALRYDPLPVFAAVLREDYKTLAAYTTSFFPLAFEACGKPFPPEADLTDSCAKNLTFSTHRSGKGWE
jgi:geranylgeranyl transferase type-2 subunit beta